ncbi:MAG: glutathione S-transferase N-terminal domain-containing protein [Caulobacteraceae bacterium]
MELLIGDKLWSTWSMRAWLALQHTGAPFTETLIRLRREETNADARAAGSPNGQVPVLKDGDVAVWDSLAICEYLAEKFPAARLWPTDPAARALGTRGGGGDALELRLAARRVPDGPQPEGRDHGVRGHPQRFAPAGGALGRPAVALRRRIPGRRLVDRRRLLHPGGDAAAQLRAAAQRLWRPGALRRLRRASAADAGVPGMGEGCAGPTGDHGFR